MAAGLPLRGGSRDGAEIPHGGTKCIRGWGRVQSGDGIRRIELREAHGYGRLIFTSRDPASFNG
jgi:hypothetical protein